VLPHRGPRLVIRKVLRARNAEQLVDVEWNPAELDRQRLGRDERVFTVGAKRNGIEWLLVLVDEADASDAEPERRLEAPKPLQMHVTGGNGGGRDARERAIDVFTGGGRQEHVLVRLRRRVAAKNPLDLDCRLEAAEELEPRRAELLLRPPCRLEQPFLSLLVLDRLVAEIEGQKEVVRVPEDAGALELAQQLDAFERLRTTLRDVAQADDQVDVVLLQIGERRTKGDCIAVHVGKECDSHPGELTGTP